MKHLKCKKETRKYIVLGFMLTYMCIATACTRDNGNNNATTDMASTTQTDTSSSATNGVTDTTGNTGTTDSVGGAIENDTTIIPGTDNNATDNANHNADTNNGSLLDDAGNTIGNIVDDAANGVSDLTNDVVGNR